MADFGLTEDMYGTNYFRRTTSEVGSEEKVPIRWMAPESIENNIYDEATDVVSNGIVHNLNLMLFTSHGLFGVEAQVHMLGFVKGSFC